MRSRSLFFIFSVLFLIIIVSTCKKSVGSNTGTSVGFYQGGISNFDIAAIDFSSDTSVVNFTVSMYPGSIKENATITAAVDDQQRINYNATSTSLLYDPLPDSCYSFSTTTTTISSGSVSAIFSITFYKNKFNRQISYMLPISIVDAEGLTIVDTLRTLYFHINGNFFTADNYTNAGTRTEYSGTDSTSAIDNIIQCPSVKYFNAITDSSSSVDYADLGSAGWQYIITVDSLTSQINVQPNSIMKLQTGGVESTFTVDYEFYDPIAHIFHIKSHYLNQFQQLRVVDETLTRQ